MTYVNCDFIQPQCDVTNRFLSFGALASCEQMCDLPIMKLEVSNVTEI